MTMLTFDMITSREVGQLLTIPIEFYKVFLDRNREDQTRLH